MSNSGCLFAILKLFGISPAPTKLPYRRKDLLTPAERSLFGVLSEAIKGRYLIFAKVRLADFLSIAKGTQGWQGHFNRINSKHIDFVICDIASVRPLLCVELDDASHASRQDRDAFKDAALLAAGLPLIRIRAAKAYNVGEIRQRIETVITSN